MSLRVFLFDIRIISVLFWSRLIMSLGRVEYTLPYSKLIHIVYQKIYNKFVFRFEKFEVNLTFNSLNVEMKGFLSSLY